MGTPEFSVPALESLVSAGHDIVAVYTQPPRKAGRGYKEKKSAVHLAAEKLSIPVHHPKSLKSHEEQKKFVDLKADIAVVVAYGLLLPKAILDSSRCINIHASLLPQWRGAAPIHRAILAGDRKTAITIMEMDEGLDTGDMLLIEECIIDKNDTTGMLHDKLKEIGAKSIVNALDLLHNNELVAIKQQGEASYAKKIEKSEAEIDWEQSVVQIDRKIRAFNPFPGAFFIHNNEKIKILEAEFNKISHQKLAGSIIKENNLLIAAIDGFIKPKILQRPGKKPMTIEEMMRGFSF